MDAEKSFSQVPTRVRFRRIWNRLIHIAFLGASLFGVLMLFLLIYGVVQQGWGWLDWEFITRFGSRFPERAGIYSALIGSIYLMLITAPLVFIIGVATAVFLEEYGRGYSRHALNRVRNRLSRLIQLNISNLAGVPSIVYGLLGLTLFVRFFALGKSLLAGALTMTLLVLPIVIVAAREAIASVPDSLRHASFAMGATRWQTIRRVVLPYAFPGILTGTILAISRAIGETAPLIMIGAVSYLAFIPYSIMDEFTVMPIQIFNWMNQTQTEFAHVAAAGILVLLLVLLSMNALAIYLRNRFQR